MSSINESALAVWSSFAPEWDAGMGRDGNLFWEVLEKPCLERLLAEKRAAVVAAAARGGRSWEPAGTEKKTVRALDISTGNGLSARWLVSYLNGDGEYAGGGGDDGAAAGGSTANNQVDVTATDGSEVMLARARQWAAANADVTPAQHRIRFAKLDLTRPEDFAPFLAGAYASTVPGPAPFDAILMNMVIMDVPTLEPLAAALPKMLAIGGVFVASLLHPVFITPRTRRQIEIVQDYDAEDGEGALIDGKNNTTYRRSLKIDRYMNVAPWRGFAFPGQSRAQYYFHRPLHELFGIFMRSGHLALDGLEEPAFTPEQAAADAGAPKLPESSRNFTEFPPMMFFRLRRIK